MAMDLSATGSHVLAGSGGGTGPGDPFIQETVEPALEAAAGTPGDGAWAGTGNGSFIALLKAIFGLLNGTLTVTPASGAQFRIGAVAVSGDTTIATGGTAQNLFASATPANGFSICNPDPINDLWVSDTTTAAANGEGSVRVAANGGYFETPPGYRPPGAVSIVGAIGAQKITARRW